MPITYELGHQDHKDNVIREASSLACQPRRLSTNLLYDDYKHSAPSGWRHVAPYSLVCASWNTQAPAYVCFLWDSS